MKKNVWIMLFGIVLIFLVALPLLLKWTNKEAENVQKQEFEKEAINLIEKAKENFHKQLTEADAKKGILYGVGSFEKEENSLPLKESLKHVESGYIYISQNMQPKAMFYSKDWCGEYNAETQQMQTNSYETDCFTKMQALLKESLTNQSKFDNEKEEDEKDIPTTETEISLDSNIIKNLHYPYMEFAIPSIEDSKKREYYRLNSYTSDMFSMDQKIALAFEHYIFVEKDVYRTGNFFKPSNIDPSQMSYHLDPVTNDTMKGYFAQFWGPDTKYEPVNFNSKFGSIATYQNGTYNIEIPYGVGGGSAGCISTVNTIPYKAVLKDNNLIIYEYAYFKECNNFDNYTYYKDKDLKEPLTGMTSDEQVEKNKESLNQYRNIFKKHSDGNYYFEKGEWQ